MRKNLLSLLIATALPLHAVEEGGGGDTLLDMDDLLGQSLDGVESAPEFVDPPDGNYHLDIQKVGLESYESKDKGSEEKTKKRRIRITYAVHKTVEMANPSDLAAPDGSLFSETFMVNADGLKYFKRQAKNVLGEDNIKEVPLKDIMDEMSNDKTILAKVKTKESTADNGKTYSNVQVHILGLVDDAQLAA